MHKVFLKGIEVSLYTDPQEYVDAFIDVTDGAILNLDNIPMSAGISCIEDMEIAIFKREDCIFTELLSTVSHELGHLIEGGYKKNPPLNKRYDRQHEKKADHYEIFVMDAYYLTSCLYDLK
jgi:hypothetical protein